MKILFVCTGNTCRSPMAEYIARDIFKRTGIKAEVSSAGISAVTGGFMSVNTRKVCEARGYDITGFRSRQITEELINGADLILTMTGNHYGYLNSKFNCSDKIYTLGEYSGAEASEIPDPFGKDLDAYKACERRIEEAISLAVDKLKNFLNAKNRKIAIGSDHAGLALKNEIIEFLRAEEIEFTDFGTLTPDSTDYPIYAKKVSEAVLSGEYGRGILVCGTGLGISMAANRIKGIRCAVCHDVFSAKATREHNDANVIAMGGRVIGAGHAIEVVKAFLETEFSGEEKHIRRINMFD